MNLKPSLMFYTRKNEINIITYALLILTDIFIAILLFYGLSQQIDQFTDEHEYFPYEYRKMLISNNWIENNIVERISNKVLSSIRSTNEKEILITKLHPSCKEIQIKFSELENDDYLISEFQNYERLHKNYNALNNNRKESEEGKLLQEQIKTYNETLYNNSKINSLIELIFKNQDNNYTKDISKFRKFFALKRTTFDFLFLLPILIAFIFWNKKSVNRGLYLQTIISSHYIIISFLPILFESVRLVIEVIPNILLKTIYDLLLELNLITIWYYCILIISILFIVFIIWLFQTKIFTKEKNRIRLYEKHKCISCNTIIDYKDKFCPICGINLYVQCPECKGETINFLPFCQKCGTKMK